MVAPNAQPSPLQHHSKSSSTFPSSLKNYSRIQSEVQREGLEVHKENLLSLSLSKKNKHLSISGEHHLEATISSSLQKGPLYTLRKTGLQCLLPTEMGPLSHGHLAQPHEHEAIHMELMASCEKSLLPATDTSEHPSTRSMSSSLSVLCSPALGEEPKNVYKLCSDTFSQTYTSASACLTTTLHQKQEYNPPQCMMMEPVGECLSDVGNVEVSAMHKGANVKRLKYTLIAENDNSMQAFAVQNLEQSFPSISVIDGSSMQALQDAASNIMCISDMSVVDWEAKTRSGFVSSCGTSATTEISEVPLAAGLKLFTNSVHAQMPKALSTFSEGEPSLPLSLEHSQQQSRMKKTPIYDGSCVDADWGKFLALSATPVANNDVVADATVLPFQQRFKQLQAFLKQCDEADQNECMQALRSLSAAARSGHAVELETRAIRLSLEEGKEMKRMRLLKVLGKMSEKNLDDAGATPQGPRLPAPGAVIKLTSGPQ